MKVYATDLRRALDTLPLRPVERYHVTAIPERARVGSIGNPQPDLTIENVTWTFDGIGWSTNMSFET